MKVVGLLGFVALSSAALAQLPDVTVKLDARLTYRTDTGAQPTQRFYDGLGRHSIVSLGFDLEPGFKAYVSQRFQRIAHDGDPDQLEEYYIEDPGLWRVGKQLAPFGNGSFFSDCIMGARGDFELPFNDGSFSVALCDAGKARERGAVGRLTGRAFGRYGISFAFGEHWLISSSSLTLFRHPEDNLGRGAGYRRVYGADYSQTFGPFFAKAEYISMNGGEGRQQDNAAFDISFSITPSTNRTFTAGYTKSVRQPVGDFYRIQANLAVIRNVSVEPMVRYRDGSIFDFSVALRVRF